MDQFACRLLGEIRYPEEYSFERVGAIEAETGPTLEEALAALGVSRVEVAPGPESLRFEVFCDACSPEEGGAVCEALMPLAGDTTWQLDNTGCPHFRRGEHIKTAMLGQGHQAGAVDAKPGAANLAVGDIFLE